MMGGLPTPVRFPNWAEYQSAAAVALTLNQQSGKYPLKLEPSSWSADVDGTIDKTQPVYADIIVDSPSRLQHFLDALHRQSHEEQDLKQARKAMEARWQQNQLKEAEALKMLEAPKKKSLLSLSDPLVMLGLWSTYGFGSDTH